MYNDVDCSAAAIRNNSGGPLHRTRIGVEGKSALTPWTSRRCHADTQVVAPAWRIPVTVQQKVVQWLPLHCPRPSCSRAGPLALPSQFDKLSDLTYYCRFWTLFNSSLTSRACHTVIIRYPAEHNSPCCATKTLIFREQTIIFPGKWFLARKNIFYTCGNAGLRKYQYSHIKHSIKWDEKSNRNIRFSFAR